MDFEEIQKELFREYVKNGYLEEWTFSIIPTTTQKKLDIAELGLITTEISEAIEEIRKENTDIAHLSVECADIIIRTLNFMSRLGVINMEGIILFKYKKNMKRKRLHGKAV